eukprot:CAMPEP_0194495450 /NCGR_PEP_ID=MMETSP0253-20130528/13041_1 /TAXON_ID=2966 /ORGANISM="Noctiluca scintillans" /LENGTH=1325 /DNA_ID=CAMNT_0039336707 /DNA_START=17 /DNA_END=3994 /DNA_ORIENTATION=-
MPRCLHPCAFTLLLQGVLATPSVPTTSPTTLFTALPTPAPTASEISEDEWIAAVDTAGRQRMLSQRMTKEYFLIVLDINPTENAVALLGTMNLFNDSLSALVNGDVELGIPTASTTAILSDLSDVETTWNSFAPLLLNPSTSVDEEHLKEIYQGSKDLLSAAASVVSSYTDAANVAGAATAGLQLDYAGRQRMLLQKVTMQSAWVAIGVELTTSMSDLGTTRDLFGDSHVALLRGVSVVGLAETESMCILDSMRTISYNWDAFEPLVEQIVYDGFASQGQISDLTGRTDELAVYLQNAVELYASDDESCELDPTHDQWNNLLNLAGKQRMLVQRISRLFFQVMKGIHVEASQVSFTTTKVTGDDSVRELIEGDIGSNVLSPPAQVIVEALLALWHAWEDFNEKVTIYSTESNVDVETLSKVASDSIDCLDLANIATELYVDAVVVHDPSVRADVLNLAGRQRMLIEKMGKEAVLLGLGVSVTDNVDNLLYSVQLFTQIHEDLLVGNESLGLEVTSDHCILQQMQVVWDLWVSYEGLVLTAGQDKLNTDTAVLEAIDDEATPLFNAMNVAVGYYAADLGVCTESFDASDWEELIREVSHLSEWTQRIAKDLCWMSRGVNFTVHHAHLVDTIDRFSDSLSKLRFGSTVDNLRAPPTDAVLNKIFAVVELWSSFKALINTPVTSAESATLVDEVLSSSNSLLRGVDDLASLYVDGAWEDNPQVNGTRILTAGRQLALIEQMTKEFACLGHPNMTRQALLMTVAEYEAAEGDLLNGVSGSEGKYDIKVTDEVSILVQMDAVGSAWIAFKPQVTEEVTGDENLQAVVLASDELLYGMDIAVSLYKRPLDDDRVPVNFLSPMPFSGSTPFGFTLSISQMVAMEIMNNEQILLPGYVLASETFDDQCDADYGQRQVLDKMASESWIALGGVSCAEVCKSTAGITDALRLPSLSYECASSEDLADTDIYPAFSRLGTSFRLAPSAVLELAPWAEWREIIVVSEPATDMLDLANTYMSVLEAGGLATSSLSAFADDFQAMQDMVQAVKNNKKRIVLVLGDEPFYQTLLCAAKVVDLSPGITWISMHSFRRSWWSRNNADLVALAPECTSNALSELLQGAINIAGLGVSLDQDRDKPLTCFPDHTSKTLSTLIETHLAEGFPSGADNAVDLPYTNIQGYGADGVCMIALMVREMLSRGYTLEQLYSPDKATYSEVISFMRTELAFEGVSGRIQLSGNELPGYLAITQVVGSESVVVGYVPPNSTGEVTIDYETISSSSWSAAPPDVEEGNTWVFTALAVVAASMLVACPLCVACIVKCWCRRAKDVEVEPAKGGA